MSNNNIYGIIIIVYIFTHPPVICAHIYVCVCVYNAALKKFRF